MPPSHALPLSGFLTLLLIAAMMGANHVAARVAFDHGTGVATAVAVRSGLTALVLGLMLWCQRAPLKASPAERRALVGIGVLIALQSACLYSAVARLPVALALLAFNTYPLTTALWARLLYDQAAPRRLLLAMPVLLAGLALALDVTGEASGLGAAAQWGRMGAGVGFALAASVIFGLALVLTQHGAGGVDGRWRSFTTMAQVAVLASLGLALAGGPQLPQASAGWWGLLGLSVLYGTAFTIMFTVLPRLGVVGNTAIMNVEPIFALVLAWALLGQQVSALQLFGAAVVVGAVVWLGLRRV